MNDQPLNTSIISIEYTDKNKRDERKMSNENFIFLDISQKLFLQKQRGEKLTLLLDAMGTWKNSLFVLIGQYLYVNFHLYNENKILDADTELEKNFLRVIYSIHGEIPSYILSCQPAKVIKKGESWVVVKRGALVLKG